MMPPSPYTWLFFDADDTLFDFPATERRALSMSFEEAGLPYPADALPVYHRINQEVWRELEQGHVTPLELRTLRFERLFNALGLQVDAETFGRRYLVHMAEGSTLLPGAHPLVEHLARNYRLGLVTNGLPEVQRPRLGTSGIAHLFSFVAISEEIGASKPDPRFFDVALDMAGHPDPRQVLVIGDSLNSDIRGGHQAGLDTLWYNPGGLSPDPRWPATYQATTLEQIGAILLI